MSNNYIVTGNSKRFRTENMEGLKAEKKMATSVKMVLVDFTIRENNQPCSFTGVLVEDVVVNNEFGRLEDAFKLTNKKPPYVRDAINLKKGTILNLSAFLKTAMTIEVGTIVKLYDLVYKVGVCYKEDKSGRETGDIYVEYSCKSVSNVSYTDEDLFDCFGSTIFGPEDKFDANKRLPYPEGVEKVEISIQKNKSETVNMMAYNPELISNDVLLSRQYSTVCCFYRIHNLLKLDNYTVSLSPTIAYGTSNIPSSNSITSYTCGKDKKMCIRGITSSETSSTNLAQSVFYPEYNKNILIGSAFYQEEIFKLGIFNVDVWRNCCSQIVLYLDAVCCLKFDSSVRAPETDSNYV